MNLIPIGDNIIVRPLPREKKLASGLIIPDSAKRPPMIGDVLAAGPGRHTETGALIQNPVKAGDRVAFHRFAGTEVKVRENEEPVVIMSMHDVLAVIETARKPSALAEHVREIAGSLSDSGQPAYVQELAKAALSLAEQYEILRIGTEAANV